MPNTSYQQTPIRGSAMAEERRDSHHKGINISIANLLAGITVAGMLVTAGGGYYVLQAEVETLKKTVNSQSVQAFAQMQIQIAYMQEQMDEVKANDKAVTLMMSQLEERLGRRLDRMADAFNRTMFSAGVATPTTVAPRPRAIMMMAPPTPDQE